MYQLRSHAKKDLAITIMTAKIFSGEFARQSESQESQLVINCFDLAEKFYSEFDRRYNKKKRKSS